jgi:hypothetical protein
MTIETAEQAYNHLKVKVGLDITKIGDGLYTFKMYDGSLRQYTARELINLAKDYSSSSKRNTTMKKNVKHFSNSKNRTKTRDALATEDFDKIPNRNAPVAEDDIWCWD